MRPSPILSLLLILNIEFIAAQTLQLPTEKETAIKADPKNKVQDTLNFKLMDRAPGTEVKIIFKDFNDGDASLGKDYEYPTNELTDKSITDASNQTFAIHVSVLPIKTDVKQKYFNLWVTYYKDKFPVSEKIKIAIDYTTDKPKSDVDTAKWFVDVIAGSNFDFFDAPVFKNFAGELKIYTPNFETIGKQWVKPLQLGLQTGIFNFRYFDADSSNGVRVSENYFLDPSVREPIVDSTKYVRANYALNSKVTYNNWGAYFDPLFRIQGNDWYDLFATVHTEFIWRTRITSNTKTDIRRDTFTLSKFDTANHIVLQGSEGIRPLYKQDNYFDVYLGVGLSFRLDIKKSFQLYLDPTVGVTNFSTTKVSQTKVNGVTVYQEVADNKTVPFFLNKFQLKTTLAPVDIVIGGEIRMISKKQLDKNPAFRAFYLAAIIPLDKLKK